MMTNVIALPQGGCIRLECIASIRVGGGPRTTVIISHVNPTTGDIYPLFPSAEAAEEFVAVVTDAMLDGRTTSEAAETT